MEPNEGLEEAHIQNKELRPKDICCESPPSLSHGEAGVQPLCNTSCLLGEG